MGLGKLLKQFMPRGLMGRSILIIVTPLVLVQVGATYFFYDRHWDTVATRLSRALAGEIGMVAEHYSVFPPGSERAWLLQSMEQRLELRFTMMEGAVLPNEPRAEPVGFLQNSLSVALQEQLQRPFTMDTRSMDRHVVIDIQLSDGVLRVIAPMKRLFTSTTYVFILWMVGTSLILLGVAGLFMRNQVRSVRRLAAAVDGFGKGRDTGAPFKPEGAAEVRLAAQAFNLMRERIQRQIAQRTEMLAGVSHDLRTPLTRMKLQLAMMGDSDDGIRELQDDVAEMERMIDGYLAFARGEGTEAPTPVHLGPLLEDVAGRFRRNGAAVDVHCEGDITLPLRRDAFGRCLSNLLSNAVRYASHVAVRAGLRKGFVDLTLDDDGPGIPENAREEVFRAFYRLDTSRNLKTGGVGLGLTIARDVVRAHGGDIGLEDSPLGGLRVRLRLPV